MKTVKIISKVLFYLSRGFAFMYAFSVFYAVFCLTTKWALEISEEKGTFNILFPFTKQPIFLGDYNLIYILFDFMMILVLYTVFFVFLSEVFKIFTRERLFTAYAVKKMKWFYLYNLIVPPAVIIITLILSDPDPDGILFLVLHFIIGVFAYFFSEIFKQGVNLQRDQDLII